MLYEVITYGFTFVATYSKTGDDPVYDPWGYSKAIVQQVLNSGLLADEDAYAARLSYDFSGLGAKGLSTYVFYAEYDGVATHSLESVDSNETNFDVQYAFSGSLEGLGLRVRHAIVDNYYGRGFDAKDTRFIVTYKFVITSYSIHYTKLYDLHRDHHRRSAEPVAAIRRPDPPSPQLAEM